MIPGPTPVPETVLTSLSKHPIGHRSSEFQSIVKKTTEQLNASVFISASLHKFVAKY